MCFHRHHSRSVDNLGPHNRFRHNNDPHNICDHHLCSSIRQAGCRSCIQMSNKSTHSSGACNLSSRSKPRRSNDIRRIRSNSWRMQYTHYIRCSGVASNPLSGTELAKLQSSLELYQNCLSRLKRDVPLYFQKQAESEPHTKKLAKALRNLASSEADTRLQNALFFCVHAYDGIEKEQASLSTASDELLRMIEESKHMVAAPFKELLADSTAGIKANANNPRNRVMCMLCTCFEIFFNGCMCTCRSTLNSYYLFMLPCLRSIASRVSSPS
jgi:hypothetical protein